MHVTWHFWPNPQSASLYFFCEELFTRHRIEFSERNPDDNYRHEYANKFHAQLSKRILSLKDKEVQLVESVIFSENGLYVKLSDSHPWSMVGPGIENAFREVLPDHAIVFNQGDW